jgi:hypothetical protein
MKYLGKFESVALGLLLISPARSNAHASDQYFQPESTEPTVRSCSQGNNSSCESQNGNKSAKQINQNETRSDASRLSKGHTSDSAFER